MTSTITSRFRKQFVQDVIADVSSNNRVYYVGLGKHSLWGNNDSTVATVVDSRQAEANFNRELLIGKRIYANNMAYMVDKTYWSSNTIYDQYDHRVDMSEKNHHVLNGFNKVYKCLFNNNGQPSTVEPNEVSNSTFITADGYYWKYMYTISTANTIAFINPDFIPVDVNNSIVTSAINGSIEVILIDAGGTGYSGTNSGYILQALTSTLFEVDQSASAENFYYNSADIYITGGSGAGQISTISNYVVNSSGKFVITSQPLSSIDVTSQYRIAPQIAIEGDGTGARAYCTVSSNSFIIDSVVMVNQGSGYTFANAYVVANTTYGSGALLTPIISPQGGHGSDPISELGAKGLCISVNIANNESNTVSTDIQFRQAAIIVDPKRYSNTAQTYSSNTFSAITELEVSLVGDPFISREMVSGLTSNASAMVTTSNSTYVFVSNVVGTFVTGELIAGANSGATASITSIANSDIAFDKHKLLYLDNFEYVQRSNTSSESVKLFINF